MEKLVSESATWDRLATATFPSLIAQYWQLLEQQQAIYKARLLDDYGTMPQSSLRPTGESGKLGRGDRIPASLTAKLFWLKRRIHSRWISQRCSPERLQIIFGFGRSQSILISDTRGRNSLSMRIRLTS
jgi:hypothetical protein